MTADHLPDHEPQQPCTAEAARSSYSAASSPTASSKPKPPIAAHAGCRCDWTTHRDRYQPDRATPRASPTPGLAGSHFHVFVAASPVQTRGDPAYLIATKRVRRG